MSRSITCVMCGREVDDADTVELPNGRVCDDPCYRWLAEMMEQGDDE